MPEQPTENHGTQCTEKIFSKYVSSERKTNGHVRYASKTAIIEFSPDGHHPERDVLRRHVVRALDFIDFVRFRHDHAVVLQNDRIGKHSSLCKEKRHFYQSEILHRFNEIVR